MMFLNLLLILFLFTALPIFFLVTKLIFSLFLSLFSNFPKKILTYLFVIFFCLSKFLNISFVAKKKLGNAVIRNKIKRRLRNIFDGIVKNNEVNFEYSYLFIAKKNVFDDDFEKIKGILTSDLKKIKK